jgi:hypothetical protein
MKENLTAIHDRFFKESMKLIDIAQGLSRLLLPERISIKIDYSSLRIEKDSWINTRLILHAADILYRAEIEVTRHQLLILFEHKSIVDNMAALQNYQNTSEIIEEEKAQNKSSILKLPPIIPIVIYHGNKLWNGDNSLKPKFEFSEGVEEFIPQQGCVVIDLGTVPDGSIKGIAEVKAFILALKYSRSKVLFEKLPQIISVFKGAGAVRQQYLEVVLLYLKCFISKKNMADFSKIVKRELELGDETMKKSSNIWAELGYIAGKDDGLKEGKAIGLKEGEGIGFKKGEGIGFKKGEGIGFKKGVNEGVKHEHEFEEKRKIEAIRHSQEKTALKLIKKGINIKDVCKFTGISIKVALVLKKKVENGDS